MDLQGKRLLVLGGQAASYDVVRSAKQMGIYTIVTDMEQTGAAKEIADETAMISTADIDALEAFVKEKKVDGVYSGPSEFNLLNVIRLSAQAGLPCYTTEEVWDRCANKDVFKQYCREYGVDCTPEYDIDLNTSREELEKIDYPIIIKPVDGCSSSGITVCEKADDVIPALEKAYAASKSKKIIAEKFIDNGGEVLNISYYMRDGEAWPYLSMDHYIADPVHKTSTASAFNHIPSKHIDGYMKSMDAPVRRMLKGMGLKNGNAFIQALPLNGKYYCCEMAHRNGGALAFKQAVHLGSINSMELMIRYAVTGKSLTDAEVDFIENLDLHYGGRYGCQLPVPLSAGKIARIEGLEEVRKHPAVIDILQYYHEGDAMSPKSVGTLNQMLCRVSFVVNSIEEMKACAQCFRDTIKVYDTEGKCMNFMPFDTARLKDI